MDFSVNIGKNIAQVIQNASVIGQQAGINTSTPACEANHLTITETVASPEDVAAANISDDALTRDDSLGSLFDKAFNLPPPLFKIEP